MAGSLAGFDLGSAGCWIKSSILSAKYPPSPDSICAVSYLIHSK
jgi:hypothetical protein